MNEFIHTFSIKGLLSEEEFDSLVAKDNALFFYNSSNKTWVLTNHANSGLRAEISAE